MRQHVTVEPLRDSREGYANPWGIIGDTRTPGPMQKTPETDFKSEHRRGGLTKLFREILRVACCKLTRLEEAVGISGN